MDAPSCYERAARAERKSALQLVQGSGLVRTVRSYAQRRAALMPQAIELLVRNAYACIVEREAQSAAHFERPAEQVIATKPRAKREARSVLCHTYQ